MNMKQYLFFQDNELLKVYGSSNSLLKYFFDN